MYLNKCVIIQCDNRFISIILFFERIFNLNMINWFENQQGCQLDITLTDSLDL